MSSIPPLPPRFRSASRGRPRASRAARSSARPASGAAAVTFGAGGAFAQAPSKQLNICIVGCGEQGLAQINAMRQLVLDGTVRVLAMADPWEFNLDYRANSFEKLVQGAKVNRYTDLERTAGQGAVARRRLHRHPGLPPRAVHHHGAQGGQNTSTARK